MCECFLCKNLFKINHKLANKLSFLLKKMNRDLLDSINRNNTNDRFSESTLRLVRSESVREAERGRDLMILVL
jgi:hypothetical protein